MMRRLAVAALAIGFGIVGSRAAHASIVEALDLAALVEQSDHIITAVAVGNDAHRDPYGRIVTDVRVQVQTRLKGSSDPELMVRRLGGTIGEIGMRVEGEAVLEMGERYVLFLRDRGDHCRATGMSQGAFHIETHGGRDMVMPGAEGLQLVSRDGGRLMPANPPITTPSPLDEFASRVRRLMHPVVDAPAGTLDVR